MRRKLLRNGVNAEVIGNRYFDIEDNTYILRTDNGGIVLKKEAMQKLIMDMLSL